MANLVLENLNQLLFGLVEDLCSEHGAQCPSLATIAFAPPRNAEHGDLATNAAMALAKPLKRNPMVTAEELAKELVEKSSLIDSAEAARPGFVNIRLSGEALTRIVRQVRQEGPDYLGADVGRGETVLLEFVSANPTGPMHIGHLRHAVLGEAIARILKACGYSVTKEFYVNDGGNQIFVLGKTFEIRLLQAQGQDAPLGEDMYPGEYLAEYARELVAEKGPGGIAQMTAEERTTYARDRCMEMIREHLALLDVEFDSYVSERALYESGRVDGVLAKLKHAGKTYEEEGAVWLKTEAEGDDKDRVLVKSDGTLTYMVPDLAYHDDKYSRSFDHYINIFGSDHAGYPPRLKAGIRSLGYDPDKLEVTLLRLVFLVREGERLDMGKRSGNVVNAVDLIQDVGADVARYFLLERSADSEINFDLDLARDHSDRNPVFKIQYAHARICSLLRKAAEAGFSPAEQGTDVSSHLCSEHERALVMALARFPEIVARCARSREPHHLPAYLLDMADLWNRYWSAARRDPSLRIIVREEPDRTRARLALAEAVHQVIRNGLSLLAIDAPERMEREEEDEDN